MEEINIDDFMQIDLRIAKVLDADMVENADKLKDQLVVCVNNLKPRQMRFGTSEGMILAAGDDDDIGIFIVSPDKGATPGMRVR